LATVAFWTTVFLAAPSAFLGAASAGAAAAGGGMVGFLARVEDRTAMVDYLEKKRKDEKVDLCQKIRKR
jgi:hypothetical protein